MQWICGVGSKAKNFYFPFHSPSICFPLIGRWIRSLLTMYGFLVSKQVVIVGNGGVGKSSMIQRYCKGIYTKDYKKTIGVDFLERQIEWVYEMHFLPIAVYCIESSTICMWLIWLNFVLQNWWWRHSCNVMGYSWYVANILVSFVHLSLHSNRFGPFN